MNRIPIRLPLAFAALLCVGGLLSACGGGSGGEQQTAIADPTGIPLGTPDVFGPSLPDGGQTNAGVPSCSAKKAISWNAAGDHVNTKVSVIGQVEDVEPSDQQLTLVMGSIDTPASQGLDIILTENALRQIEGDASQIFGNAQICVTGVIQAVGGNLQIVVDQSKDIELL